MGLVTNVPGSRSALTIWRQRLAVICVATLYCGSTLRAETAVGLAGGDDAVWLYRTLEPEPDGTRFLKFAYAVPGKTEMRFHALSMTPAGGEIAAAAACGESLHIFFADGTHYRLRPPQPPRRPGHVEKNDFPEVNLPENKVPLALCGDDETGMLAAIVPVETARLIAADEAETRTRQQDEDAEENANTARNPEEAGAGPAQENAAEVHEPALPDQGFALVEYTGSAWRVVRAVPASFDDQSACSLAARAQAYHLVFTSVAAPDAVRYTTLPAPDGAWSNPQTVPGVRPADVLGAAAFANTVAVVISPAAEKEDRFTVHAVELDADAWHVNAPLALADGPLTCTRGTTAVHRFQDKLVVALLEKEDDQPIVRVGLWPLAGGEPLSALGEVTAMRRAVDHASRERWRMFIASVVIVSTLAIVFLRRQDSFLTDLPAPPGYVLAGLGRRFMAFVIDLAIVACPVTALLLAPWLRAHNIPLDENLGIELNNLTAQEPDVLFWPWLAAMGIYILYGIVFEAIFAATPGKLLLRLRVAGGSDGRPSLGAIIIRNVLRFELYFMLQLAPTAIIVAITRNRQRLGDLVARTTVVQKVE